MSKQRKCATCGKLGHQARTCGKESTYKPRGKAKGQSWLRTVAKKMSEAEEAVSPTTDAPPSPGEPFADLPPIEVPGTSSDDAPGAGDSSGQAGDDSATATAPNAGPATSSGKRAPTGSAAADLGIGTEELAAMLGDAAEQYVTLTGAYAAERGFLAFGGPFAKIAGASVRVIVKSQAATLEIDPAEAAAWIAASIIGGNSVQAMRAYKDEQKKQEEAKTNERAQRSAPATANGVKRPDPRPVDAEVLAVRSDQPFV